ncbi:hypothetical protein ACFXJ8_23365 [Nonomuraea sp. NPDC059194]|uniref:AMP-binding enzyme n=1 Tax=Nonomuraea sp. NPDC059194 TaxID=3346764 RepID=UPI00369820D6
MPWESGEAPKAFVVRAPGSALTGDEVIAYSRAGWRRTRRSRVVEFIDAVPKSASGKILWKDLRAR